MKILLIYNPQAGHGRAGKLLPLVESKLQEKNIAYDLKLTAYPGHGSEIVQKTTLDGYDGLVAAGGDGTLFELINGVFNNPAALKPTIGILPIGTGNAFVRDLELDNTQWAKALDIIAAGKTRKVDVGKFLTEKETYYYLNILGLGFVTDVSEIARKLKLFGNIAYTFGVLYRTLFLKADKLSFEIDGKKFECNATFVEISNTRYTANFLMAPNAQIDDGLLDVTIAKKLSRLRLLQSFPKIFSGEHVNMPEVETYQARQIKIKSARPKMLAPDGELLGSTPVEITCLKQAIEVFWR